jgi:hypothetical protein
MQALSDKKASAEERRQIRELLDAMEQRTTTKEKKPR